MLTVCFFSLLLSSFSLCDRHLLNFILHLFVLPFNDSKLNYDLTLIKRARTLHILSLILNGDFLGAFENDHRCPNSCSL